MPRAASNAERTVTYFKLEGDYYRYVAEVGEGDRLKKATDRALNCYNSGMDAAEELSAADPARLSLMLNFSVFCYENLDKKEDALQMASQAYEDAAEEFE